MTDYEAEGIAKRTAAINHQTVEKSLQEWVDNQNDIEEAVRLKTAEREEKPKREVEILVPGRQWVASDPDCDLIQKLLMMARHYNWRVQIGYAKSFHPSTASNRKDYVLHTVWMDANKHSSQDNEYRGVRAVIAYESRDGIAWKIANCHVNGVEVSKKEFQDALIG